MDNSSLHTKVEAQRHQMLIIWLAMLTSIGLYTAVAYFAHGAGVPGVEDDARTLIVIFFLLGLSTFGLSFVVKRMLLAKATGERNPAQVQSAYIVAYSLCDAAALFGLVALFTTSLTYSYLLFLLGAVGILLHAPRRDHLLAAYGGGNQTQTWSNTRQP